MTTLHLAGRVRTMHPAHPVARSVTIQAGRITAIDGPEPAGATVWLLPDAACVLPGFRDPHLHLMAMAAELWSVDCGPDHAATIGELLARLETAARRLPEGSWVRASGYDDAFLAERRHPSRGELDRAVPDRKLLLHHATGHVVLANAAALNALGEPGNSGVIRGSDERLRTLVPRPGASEVAHAVQTVSAELAGNGVTAVTDATVTNGVSEWEHLSRLVRDDVIVQRLSVMPGVSRLGEMTDAGLRFGTGDGRVRVGHAKLYAEDEDDPRFIAALAEAAHRSGWPVAIHVLDIAPLDMALGALERFPAPAGTRDRLEHVALCLPEQVRRIAAVRVHVVTQPGFITQRGSKYLEALSPVELDWVYPAASLIEHGVHVAGSSDAPVSDPDPLRIVHAAVTRQADGVVIGPQERVGMQTALRMVTGVTALGEAADLVVLDRDPLEAGPDRLLQTRVLATFVAGTCVYPAGGLNLPV